MNKLERKFGKYAIKNISLILVLCYAVGFVIQNVRPQLLIYLTLDTYQILHGQIWRLITWLLVPPPTYNFFTLAIMMLFYYSIGTSLEHTWGAFRYNLYLLSGMIFTVVGCFIVMGVIYLIEPGLLNASEDATFIFLMQSRNISTVYVNMSIFLAFAVTFPEAQVRLMFLIPVKVKWLGIAYGVMLVMEFITINHMIHRIIMVASMMNFLLFWLLSKRGSLSPKQAMRKQQFRREVRKSSAITRHKCAVCGRTDEDSPELEFRFCSKCNGNYEYCQNHLFTHEHIK